MFQPAMFETWGLAKILWKLGLVLGGKATWLKIWRWKAIWAICRWQNSKKPPFLMVNTKKILNIDLNLCIFFPLL